MLAIDLLAHRNAHVIGFKEAACLERGVGGPRPRLRRGRLRRPRRDAGLEFTTAWLLEKSLSVDNLFVFALIFGYFKVPRAYQHRVLFFGVIGALVFRAIFLAAGVAIVSRFTAVLFVFAAILLLQRLQAAQGRRRELRPGQELRRAAAAQDHAGSRRVRRHEVLRQGSRRRVATPLLAVVVAIEAADLVFAVDSVPAVLAVSDDAFIVYTSNAFAILGLRALYFLLAGLLDRFHYLSKGLAIILAFIGVKLILQAAHKMISTGIPEIPSLVSLAVIVVVLAGSVVLSIRNPQPTTDENGGTAPRDENGVAPGQDGEQPPTQETQDRGDPPKEP